MSDCGRLTDCPMLRAPAPEMGRMQSLLAHYLCIFWLISLFSHTHRLCNTERHSPVLIY